MMTFTCRIGRTSRAVQRGVRGGVAFLCLVLPFVSGVPVRAGDPVEDSFENPCNPIEGRCDDSPGVSDPLWWVNATGETLTDMHEDLLANWFGGVTCGIVETGPPVQPDAENPFEAFSQFFVYDYIDGTPVSTGDMTTVISEESGQVDFVLFLVKGTGQPNVSEAWWLTQTVLAREDGSVYISGTLEHWEFNVGTITYQGGWEYDPVTGPVESPGSDPEFHTQVSAMLGCDASAVAGGFGFGSILRIISNVFTIAINYIRDSFIPYTPPTSCSGPTIDDGPGGSCDSDEVSCDEDLDDIAEKIDGIPGASKAFKKCMKGRFGCGGSSHRRLRVVCDDSDSCGTCGSGAGGCNIGGSTMQYCQDESIRACVCVDTVFHEMAHSCGIAHSQQYLISPSCAIPNERACEIGIWFGEQLDPNCYPISRHTQVDPRHPRRLSSKVDVGGGK